VARCEFATSRLPYALCIPLATVLSEVICYRAVAIINLKGRKLWDLFPNPFPERIKNRPRCSYALHSASSDGRVQFSNTNILQGVPKKELYNFESLYKNYSRSRKPRIRP
jgi:hypothetical protein